MRDLSDMSKFRLSHWTQVVPCSMKYPKRIHHSSWSIQSRLFVRWTIYLWEPGYNPCLPQAHLSVIFYSLLPIAMTVGGTIAYKYERHWHINYCLFSGNSGLAPLWPLHGPPWRASRSFWNVFAVRVCCMHSVVSFSLHSSVPGGGSPWLGPSQPYPSPLFFLGPCSNSPGFGEAFRLLWCVIVMKQYFL